MDPSGYIPEGHEDRYKDLEIRKKSDVPHADGQYTHCPVCDGYGGWNNIIDAYGAGEHFQSMCQQCWGWGWVEEDSGDNHCIHKLVEQSLEWCKENDIYHAGMCYHVSKCSKCGKIVSYDSSG